MSAHSAQAEPVQSGDNSWALPGVNRTNLISPEQARAHIGIAATTGYGYTEAIGADTGTHTRGQGSLAVSYSPYSWLSAALRLQGRIDLHPDDAWGEDRTFVAEPAMALRVGGRGPAGLDMGAQVVLVAPGSEAPSIEFGALSFEMTGMLQHRIPDTRFTLAGELGYRRDRSGQVVDDPLAIRPGDRIALSVSDFDATLIRAAALADLGPLEPFAELSSEVLVGDKAPSVGTSPIRFGLGARLALTEGIALSLTTETALSSRPAVHAYAPMVPIDPRFTVFAGIQTRVGLGPKPPQRLVVAPPKKPIVTPPPPPPKVVSTHRQFSGRVVDSRGRPLVDVMVRVEAGGQFFSVQTSSTGEYLLEGIPKEKAILSISAEGYHERRLEIAGEDSPNPKLVVEEIADQGWLRGEVTNYEGDPMQAQVTVGGRVLQTGEDGFFDLSLPVGDYEVEVVVEGYLSQRHHLKVEEGAVVIVNAELRPRKKRRGR